MSSTEDAFAALSVNETDQATAPTGLTGAKADANLKDLESAQLARAKGWVEPELYDYDTYNTSRGREEAKATEGEAVNGEAETTQDVPEWAANAAKYEWNDEYGDVGPPFPDLEKQLFKDEFTNRIGLNFKVYVPQNVLYTITS